MLDFVIFAATFLIALLVAIIWLYPSSKKVTTVPGLDPSSKEDGNLNDIIRAGSLHEFLLDLHGQFGSITGFWWGKTYVVSIASPELFKAHQNVFDRPGKLFEIYHPIHGPTSIQLANGSDGRARRRHYDKAFASEILPKYSPYFQKVANEVEQKWLKIGPDDHLPLTEHTGNYAFKSIALALFGEEFNDDSLVSKMETAYEKAWSEIEHHFLGLHAPNENVLHGKQLSDAMDCIHTIIREVVAAHKKQGLKLGGNKFIDILAETCPDETTLLSDAVTYLTEGLQTSWNVLSWGFYFLATHKDVQSKLYKEIKQILGEKGVIDESNFSEFKYMIQVINETLRCAVVSPWTARFQEFDSELGGHKIPKNTPVIHALGVVMQDASIWSLPNKFDPDRFNEENKDKQSPLSFPAFGFAGKRKCPGEKFSYLETAVLFATLIRRFEVSMWDDQVVEPFYGLFSRPEEEIWIKLVKR